MKPNTPKLTLIKSVSSSSLIALLGLAALSANSASAQTIRYWDQDGTTAGFGLATGTWTNPTVSRWSTSAAGTATPGASITTLIGDPLHFGTDSVALGTGSITVTGTVNAASLRFGSATTGNVTLSGGTINLGAATTIHVGAGSTTVHTISSVITGAGTSLTKTGNTLSLSGANTYTGQTIIPTGVLSLANANPLGTIPGTNGTSSISLAAGTTLSSATGGANPSTTIAAPITLTGAGNTTLRIGQGAASNTHTFNLNGAIGGTTGNLVYTTATGSFSNGTSLFVLGAAGTYTGNTLITTGNGGNNPVFVRAGLGVVNALPTTTVLTFDQVSGGGTGRNFQYDLNGNNQTLAGLDNGGVVPQVRRMIVTSTADAELTINNTADYTFGGSTVSTSVGTIGTTTRAQITGAINLTKSGAGTFTLGGTLLGGATAGGNTFTGATKVLGGILVLGEFNSLQNSAFDTTSSIVGDATNGLRATPTTLTLGGLTGTKNFADVFTTTTGGYGSLTALTLNPGTGATPSYSGDIGDGATGLNLTKSGAGTQTLAGVMSHTGTTSVNAGTLTLDYSTQDSSKLSNTAALILGGGTLNLSGGTHAETVLSTTLTAGTASRVTSSGAAPLQLNTITVGDGASVDFGASGIATTDNLNTALGILGTWATVNGSLAVNSTNTADGLITAATSSDVTRLDGGLQVIPDGSTNNIRIIEGTGTAANLTLGAATTTVSTLFQSPSGGTSTATIDSASQTLRANAILVGSGAGAMTIGNGTLTAANPGGDLDLSTASSTNTLTINSVIANNTTASTLTKTGLGNATLSGDNTYDGATNINGGTLSITHINALGSTLGATTLNGGNGTGANSLSLTSATTDLAIAENLNLFGNLAGRAQLINGSAQNHTLTGAINVSSDTNLSQFNSGSTGSITVSGDITGTLANGAILFLRGTSTSDLNRVVGSLNLTGGNLAKTDAGTWLVGAPGKTYSWVNTQVAVGTLKMGLANILPSTGVLSLGNTTGGSTGSLDLNGFNQSAAGIAYNGLGVSTGTRAITNSDVVNAAVFTINNVTDNVSGNVTGANNIVLTGNLALTKLGAGNLTLRGNNTFTGVTTVSAGTLTAAKNDTLNALSTGDVSIASGATVVVDIVKTTAVTDTVSNIFTGSGLLKVQYAAGATARNMTMPNVTGFNGTIQLSNLGATGDKWNAANLGTVAGSLLVDAGSTFYVTGVTGTSFADGITINGAGNSEGRGAIRLGAVTLGGNVSLASSATISMESVASALLTGNISSSVAGANTLTLGGTGSTGGTLSGNISDGTGTIVVTQAVGSYTLPGELSHSGGVNVTAGTLTLGNGNNTYAGATAINGGALIVSANNALGAIGAGNETNVAGTAGVTGPRLGLSGGIIYSAQEKVSGAGWGDNRGFIQSVSGSNTFAGPIELNANGLSRIGTQDGASLTLTGAITQGVGITTANILFRTGSNAGDFVTLSNSGNSFGGDSTVFNAATAGNYAGLRLGVSNALPTNLSISGFSGTGAGTALDLNGKNQNLNGLTNGAQLKIINLDTVAASTLTLNPTADQSTTATTILGGGGLGVINLVKDGAFTQTLVGTNTYTGNTTVNAGILSVSGANLADTSTVSVATGAVLNLNFVGTDTVASLVLNGVSQPGGVYDATTSPASISGTGSITVTPLGPTYTSFKTSNFTLDEQGDSLVSGPDADPDFDGVSNLLEYAFKTDPRVAGRANLPVGSAVPDAGSTYVGCVYTRIKGATDLTFTPQFDSTLPFGTPSTDATVISVVDNLNGTETVTLRDNTPVTAGNKRFVRIFVTSTP